MEPGEFEPCDVVSLLFCRADKTVAQSVVDFFNDVLPQLVSHPDGDSRDYELIHCLLCLFCRGILLKLTKPMIKRLFYGYVWSSLNITVQ